MSKEQSIEPRKETMDSYEWHRSASGKAPAKRRRNIEQLTKSYVDLVAEAISSTPNKTMTVSEICAYLKNLYGSGKSEITLKNTVRHTLSCYSIFKKVRKEEYNRPALWTVLHEDYFLHEALGRGAIPGPSSAFPEDQPSTSQQRFDWLSMIRRGHPTNLSRDISISCPLSLNKDPDGDDFVEPSAARYSVPIALDKMQ